MQPLVSIIVPHYQTPELAKLCLRSIRRFTVDIPYEVIVIDNASKDTASLQYLRGVEWIRLIEREGPIPVGGPAHIQAVTMGFAESRAPFVLTIHTDTIPIRTDWLQYHLDPLRTDPKIAAIGTDKLVLRSAFQQQLRVMEDTLMFWKRFRSVRQQNRDRYIRSHCALYRKELMERHGLTYSPIPGLTAGQGLHRELTRFGYECRLLDPERVAQRVVHLNHATELLLPELQTRSRLLHLWRGRSRIARFFQRAEIRALMADDSLDQQASPITKVA